MVAQVPAVVAPKHHDGVFGKTRFFQLIEHLSDLGIDIADRCKISMAELSLVNLRNRLGKRRFFVSGLVALKLPASVQAGRINILRNIRGWGQRDFLLIIHIPIFCRRVKRQVRFKKAHTQKEGLILLLEFFQVLNSQFGGQSIRIAFIIHLSPLIGFDLFVPPLAVGAISISKKGIPARFPFAGIKHHFIPTVRKLQFGSYRIGVPIQQSVGIMAYLSDANRIIAVPFQVMDESFGDFRFRFP